MPRIAAIDYGKARIGLALSDERAYLASTLAPIRASKKLEETAAEIATALKPHPVSRLVIGLPLHLNGRESLLSIEVRQLATLLEAMLPIPITLWDERLSTAQTERMLKESGFSRKERTTRIDSACAAAILQSFLDCNTQNGYFQKG